jgi:hypothetical protein
VSASFHGLSGMFSGEKFADMHFEVRALKSDDNKMGDRIKTGAPVPRRSGLCKARPSPGYSHARGMAPLIRHCSPLSWQVRHRNQLLAPSFGVSIVGVIIAGSLWIMYHLDMNMMMPASEL